MKGRILLAEFFLVVKWVLLASDANYFLLLGTYFIYIMQLSFHLFSKNDLILSYLIWIKVMILQIWRIWTTSYFVQNVLWIYSSDPRMEQYLLQTCQRS